MADTAPAAAGGRTRTYAVLRLADARLRTILTTGRVIAGSDAQVALTSRSGAVHVRVHSTDHPDVGVTASVGGRGNPTDSTFTVPLTPLARLLATIPPGQDAELAADGDTVVLRAGTSAYPLPPSRPVPTVRPWQPAEALARVDAVVFRQALRHLEPILASSRAHRTDLDVVRIETRGDESLRLAATDLRGLTVVDVPAIPGTARVASVHGRRLTALGAILSHGTLNLAVVAGGHLAVRGDIDSALVLAAGPLDSVEEHLPGAVAGTLTTSAAALRAAVTRLSSAKRPLHLRRDGNRLRIGGPDGHEYVDLAAAAGHPLDCWLNPGYVLVALRACRADAVTLVGHRGRGSLVPVTFQTGSPGFRHLLKPCLPPGAR